MGRFVRCPLLHFFTHVLPKVLSNPNCAQNAPKGVIIQVLQRNLGADYAPMFALVLIEEQFLCNASDCSHAGVLSVNDYFRTVFRHKCSLVGS